MSFDLVVPPDCPAMRLDQFVVSRIEGVSRRRLRGIDLRLNGRPAKHGTQVQPGDVVSLPEALLESGVLAANPERSLPILYEDEVLIAIDKPAGMASVARGPADRDCVANVLVAFHPEVRTAGGPFEGGLVHRLDHDTSGVLLAARSAAAHQELRRQFAAHQVEKQYLALVLGELLADGEIHIPIAHDPRRADRMVACREAEKGERLGARPASTHYQPVLHFDGATLVRISMHTGLRHQVRVHLAAIGHPIAGDRLYGPGPSLTGLRRQGLHASRVTIRHPGSGEQITIESPLPGDFEDALQLLERR